MNKNVKISLILLYFIFLFPLILTFFLGGGSTSRVISGSLSVRNYGEIIGIAFGIFFVFTHIKFFSKHCLNNKYLKPFFYLSFIYIGSTIWSDLRLLTFFRATEFFIIGVLSLIVYNEFSTVDNKFNHKGLRRYLYHIVIIGILSGLIKRIAFDDIIIEQNFLADNALALLLAGSFLICFYQNFFLKDKNKSVLFLFIGLVFFSFSLTALVTTVICIFYLYLSRSDDNKKYLFLIAILITLVIYFYIGDIRFINELLSYVSFRDIERIETLTGRENIWKLTLEELDGRILGSGFATDMQLLMSRFMLNEINTVSSGHNVFLESYIAAKWLGVIVVMYSFFFWFKKAKICFPKEHASLVESLVFFALISGFTSSGYGGSLVSHPYILFWVTFTPLIISTNNEKK